MEDKGRKNETLKKVSIFLAKVPWKKVLTFFICLFLSACFWFMQVYRQNFNVKYDIPVKYTSVPDSILFDSELPPKISLNIKDDGFTLFKYYFTKTDDTLRIDVKDVLLTSSNKKIDGSFLSQSLRRFFSSSTELISYEPNSISFRYSLLEQKKVPVIFDGQIYLAANYLLNGDIQLTPDSVVVYGTKQDLNNLNYAYTVNDTIRNLHSQNVFTCSIKEIKNLKFVPAQIEVMVPAEKYTQKDIEVPIECRNLPNNLGVKFFPSNVRISFLVGLSKYHSITDKDFVVDFDYNDLKELKGTRVPLRITSSPSYVENLAMDPQEVEFIFEQN